MYNFLLLGLYFSIATSWAKNESATPYNSIMNNSSVIFQKSVKTDSEIFRKFNLKVTIEQFGAKGNGVEDDSAAFTRFNSWAIKQTEDVTLDFKPNKIYINSNNCFTYNISTLTVNGNGSTLRNPAPNGSQNKGFNTAAGMNKRNSISQQSAQVDYYLINSTFIGDNFFTLKNKKDSERLIQNEWICIGSHDVYPVGFPPNFKYYEFVKIISIDTILGRINVDRPLKYSHREDAINWSGNKKFTGKASIYKIEQGSKWNINHTFNDLTFDTPHQKNKSGDYVTCSGKKITMNRCKAYAFNPSVAGTVTFNACLSLAYTEFDKLVDTVVDNGSKWKRIANGAGIKYIELNNSKVDIVANLSPKRLQINNLDFTGGPNDFQIASAGEMESLKIKNGSFTNFPNAYTTNLSQNNPFILGSNGVKYIDSTDELLVPCSKYSLINQLKMISIGQILSIVTSESGNAIHTPYNGKVSHVRCDNDTAYINIKFNTKLLGNETIIIFKEPQKVDIENVRIAGKSVTRDYLKQSDKKFELLNFTPSLSAVTSFNYFGFPKKIYVNVKRVYTGNNYGDAFLNLNFSSDKSNVIKVDLRSKGIQEITTTSIGSLNKYLDNKREEKDKKIFKNYINKISYKSTIDFSKDIESQRPVIDIRIEF